MDMISAETQERSELILDYFKQVDAAEKLPERRYRIIERETTERVVE